jgi:DNA invertase Pin-like site-specific DNA recombinase
MRTLPQGAKEGEALKAIGYVRVSTERQGESGLGLEAQRSALEEASARLGAASLEVFEDSGLSGTLELAKRPGLLDAVAALGAGDVLLVARRDRLGRDVVNVALIEREVERRGARIVSASGEGSELEGPTGNLVRTILDAVNAYERGMIALRTRAALRAKKARGERAGNVPWGWTVDRAGKLAPNPLELEVTKIVGEFRTYGWSFRAIEAELRGRGVVGRSGRPLTLRRIHQIAKGEAA